MTTQTTDAVLESSRPSALTTTLLSPPLDFTPVAHTRASQLLTRPSLSYWQDAWRRLRANPRAVISLYVVLGLLAFTLLGPFVWQVDPAQQDVDQISQPPGLRGSATIAEPYRAWRVPPPPPDPQTAQTKGAQTAGGHAPARVDVDGAATTQAVRLLWPTVAAASRYRIYRSLLEPHNAHELGLPLGEVVGNIGAYEDRMDLEAVRYFYSVTTLTADEVESPTYAMRRVDVERVITPAEAQAKGLVASGDSLTEGQHVPLALHPLGTDYLGRDILARLIYGARVSLFIGIFAPLLYVSLGVLYGAIAGFLGGAVDGLMMRFADFAVALPFLLLMILIRVSFGIGGGESGILPMLIALVALSWPSTARLVRGQILQIREEGYIQAARLLGAPTGHLVLRHMIPNTLGVILVTFTFAVPGAIFTEAFLSFIGMGVAPPTPSWGSMCNEGRKTMLSYPHELIAPALLISLTVLAFNLLGDGLRDALDARLRSRE